MIPVVECRTAAEVLALARAVAARRAAAFRVAAPSPVAAPLPRPAVERRPAPVCVRDGAPRLLTGAGSVPVAALAMRCADAVAAEFCAVPSDIVGLGRGRAAARLRQVWYWCLERRSGLGPYRIGQMCGGRNTSTILRGVCRVEALRRDDPEFARRLARVLGAVAADADAGAAGAERGVCAVPGVVRGAGSRPVRGAALRCAEAVAAEFGGTVPQIAGGGMTTGAARRRQVWYWLVLRVAGLGPSAVARLCGGRNHATVLHGARRVEAWRGADPAFAARIDRLLAAQGAA